MATIIVDIGHDKNTWATGGGKGVKKNGVVYEEHTFNSNVAIRLKEKLEAAGHKVIMFQKPHSDGVSLNKRVQYYNSIKADLIISIHANAAGNQSAKGLCAFYWITSEKGKRAANLYAKHAKQYGYDLYSNGTYDSRDNHWSDFAMLEDTKHPAILTENGFMTNDKEFELIFKSKKYVEDVADIHARLVADYFGTKYVAAVKVEKKEESVQIRTGGLSPESVYEVVKYLDSKKWWYQIQGTSDGENPTAISGGLSGSARTEFEKWLKAKGWHYSIV